MQITDHQRLMLAMLVANPGITEGRLIAIFERALDDADDDPVQALAAYREQHPAPLN